MIRRVNFRLQTPSGHQCQYILYYVLTAAHDLESNGMEFLKKVIVRSQANLAAIGS